MVWEMPASWSERGCGGKKRAWALGLAAVGGGREPEEAAGGRAGNERLGGLPDPEAEGGRPAGPPKPEEIWPVPRR